MEYNQFKALLQLQGIRDKETTTTLNAFIEEFPYCQTSRLLLAKALHEQQSLHYDKALKLAAIYATNREVLHDLIGIKTGEVEFEFPLKTVAPEKESIDGLTVSDTGTNRVTAEESYDEWYAEDEISGKAFEEQREKEKLEDPHELIRKRLDEILNSKTEASLSEKQNPDKVPDKKFTEDDGRETKTEVSEKPALLYEEDKTAGGLTTKFDAEETVFKEEVMQEQIIEKELLNPVPEKSEAEKVIIREAGKARDVLDKLEVEHALEESILESLEKLPVLTPTDEDKEFIGKKTETENVSEQKSVEVEEKSTPRSFIQWLKVTSGKSSSGFKEVKAAETGKDGFIVESSNNEEEEAELQLSDDELIEKFLIEEPKIGPSRLEFYSPINQAKKSVMDHDDVVSETLARIYREQGKFKKARWCYEKLSLLYPEKSTFFAALLKEIPEKDDK